jgi:hypothetical protein
MKRIFIILAATLLVALALLASVRAAGELTIGWWSVDGGGSHSSGGAYTVEGTIGQADAGTPSSDRFTVAGGYWAVALPRSRVLVPLIGR